MTRQGTSVGAAGAGRQDGVGAPECPSQWQRSVSRSAAHPSQMSVDVAHEHRSGFSADNLHPCDRRLGECREATIVILASRSPEHLRSRLERFHHAAPEPLADHEPLPAVHCAMCSERSRDRKSTRLNSSHVKISYAVFCLKKKKKYKR